MSTERGLVLIVIDALAPEMLLQAVSEGLAPTFGELISRGEGVIDCVSAFPSLTPVCAATIATGQTLDRHLIPGLNWYHRGEGRYIEYGSSLRAARAAGIRRSLTDVVYNLNLSHLSPGTETVFERLDRAGLRTACTTYMVYRGRHRHFTSSPAPLGRLATATLFRHAIYGPTELFYADLIETRATGCRSQLGLPGVRDEHACCVGEYLVRNDLFDFLLLSLTDNDTRSHRHGPSIQPTSVAELDKQLVRVMAAAGGLDRFLQRYNVVVASDHGQDAIREPIHLFEALSEFKVLGVADNGKAVDAELAVCPGSRSAAIYGLDGSSDSGMWERVRRSVKALPGVDLLAELRTDGKAELWSPRGELIFSPGGDGSLKDLRGSRWQMEGEAAALMARVEGGTFLSPDYPDALERLWRALHCPNSGDLLISAAPGYEFPDWGGVTHVGGGGHGSLHRVDSMATLLWCGDGLPKADLFPYWRLSDIASLVLASFSLSMPGALSGQPH